MTKAALLLFLAITAVAIGRGHAAEPPELTVWKTPWCGCCTAWADHMAANGFAVTVREREDLDAIKERAGVPEQYRSCHTARVAGYVIEGHVPAADVKRLLNERPDARGLAVPGMPSGSPGMENGLRDAYDVLLLGPDGTAERFSSYR